MDTLAIEQLYLIRHSTSCFHAVTCQRHQLFVSVKVMVTSLEMNLTVVCTEI